MENKTKFKVGDKVVCISSGLCDLTEGKTYTVEIAVSAHILLEADDGYDHLVDACDFKLAEESENKPFETRNDVLQAIIDGKTIGFLSNPNLNINHDTVLSYLGNCGNLSNLQVRESLKYKIGDTFKYQGRLFLLIQSDTSMINLIDLNEFNRYTDTPVKVRDIHEITSEEFNKLVGRHFDDFITVEVNIKEK